MGNLCEMIAVVSRKAERLAKGFVPSHSIKLLSGAASPCNNGRRGSHLGTFQLRSEGCMWVFFFNIFAHYTLLV